MNYGLQILQMGFLLLELNDTEKGDGEKFIKLEEVDPEVRNMLLKQ